MARTILQGTMKGARKRGRQKKRWEDNIKKLTGMEFGDSLRAAEDREWWEGIVATSSVVPRRPSRLRDWDEMRDTTALVPTGRIPDCILLFCYPHAHYQTEYYCSATNRPITILYTTVLIPTWPLPDCKLLFCYPHAYYQTVYSCSATKRPITRQYTTVLLPTGPLPDCILLVCYQHAHYQTVYYCSATHMPITRLYTTVLLPTCPVPNYLLLLCYQHAHYQTVYYWSSKNEWKEQEREEDRRRDMKITSRNGREWGLDIPWGQRKTGKDRKVLSQRHLWCPDDLQDWGTEMRWDIPLFCYQQAHNQTVYYCSTTHMPITRVNTTVLLPTGPLPDCILLFCYQQAHYLTV